MIGCFSGGIPVYSSTPDMAARTESSLNSLRNSSATVPRNLGNSRHPFASTRGTESG